MKLSKNMTEGKSSSRKAERTPYASSGAAWPGVPCGSGPGCWGSSPGGKAGRQAGKQAGREHRPPPAAPSTASPAAHRGCPSGRCPACGWAPTAASRPPWRRTRARGSARGSARAPRPGPSRRPPGRPSAAAAAGGGGGCWRCGAPRPGRLCHRSRVLRWRWLRARRPPPPHRAPAGPRPPCWVCGPCAASAASRRSSPAAAPRAGRGGTPPGDWPRPEGRGAQSRGGKSRPVGIPRLKRPRRWGARRPPASVWRLPPAGARSTARRRRHLGRLLPREARRGARLGGTARRRRDTAPERRVRARGRPAAGRAGRGCWPF